MSARVVFETLRGDESSPLHCVIPFSRTGCIRDVAGGKVAAPTSELILKIYFLISCAIL